MSATASQVPGVALTFSRWLADTLLRWRTIASVLAATALLAILALFFIPPVYRSRASFVANRSAADKLPGGLAGGGALGGLATQLGMSATLDPSESPNFYMELIRSRELLTRLLHSRFADPRTEVGGDSVPLLDLLRIRKKDPLRKLELGIKRMSSDIDGNFELKTNLVWIEVNAEWPDLSAAVANRTLELVTAFNKEQRTSRAKSKRVFLEGRVALAKAELQSAEARLRAFSEQNRSWRSSPSLVFAEKQLQRDEDRAADLYLSLQRQLETALLDEVNDAALITVVDSAVPPRKAQWPRYGVLLVSTVLAGLILGLMVAGGAAILADWRARNPSSSSHFRESLRRVGREMGSVFKRKR